jgi:hypothetical protein
MAFQLIIDENIIKLFLLATVTLIYRCINSSKTIEHKLDCNQSPYLAIAQYYKSAFC